MIKTSMASSNKGESLLISAPAKINLHLEVLGLRSDNFHELAMIMQTIDLADKINFKKEETDLIALTCDDQTLSTDQDNLIIRAAQLLRSTAGCLEFGVHIHLEKKIPIGAGLAGGSSDAAATLVGLNRLWNLGFSISKLKQLAKEIGSDIPFCLEGGTRFCFGRGEQLEAFSSHVPEMAVLLVKDPSVSVSTPWAYKLYKQNNIDCYLNNESDFEKQRESLRLDSKFTSLGRLSCLSLRNDLEKVVAPKVEAVQKSLSILSEIPESLAVSMSGSGPSCFALFSNLETAKNAFQKSRYKLDAAGLKSWCCAFRKDGARLEK